MASHSTSTPTQSSTSLQRHRPSVWPFLCIRYLCHWKSNGQRVISNWINETCIDGYGESCHLQEGPRAESPQTNASLAWLDNVSTKAVDGCSEADTSQYGNPRWVVKLGVCNYWIYMLFSVLRLLLYAIVDHIDMRVGQNTYQLLAGGLG